MGFTSGRVLCCARPAVLVATVSGIPHPAGAQDFRRGDANTDGYLFASGRAPAAPFEDCGLDPEPDGLGCIDYPGCP